MANGVVRGLEITFKDSPGDPSSDIDMQAYWCTILGANPFFGASRDKDTAGVFGHAGLEDAQQLKASAGLEDAQAVHGADVTSSAAVEEEFASWNTTEAWPTYHQDLPESCFTAAGLAAHGPEAPEPASLVPTTRHTTKATKITAEDAIEIFKARGPGAKRSGVSRVLADRYGISMKAVRDVWNMRTWSDVTMPFCGSQGTKRCEGNGWNAGASVISSTEYCPEALFLPLPHPAGTSYKPMQTFAPAQYRPEALSPLPTASTFYKPMQTFAPAQYRPEALFVHAHADLCAGSVQYGLETCSPFSSSNEPVGACKDTIVVPPRLAKRRRLLGPQQNGPDSDWSEDAFACFEKAVADFDGVLHELSSQPFAAGYDPIPKMGLECDIQRTGMCKGWA